MKPRERMLRAGPEALSNEELIAILLRTGSEDKGVLELARDILKAFPKLSDLVSASLQEIMRIKGVGMAKATAIKAAVELGKRLHTEITEKPKRLKSVKDVLDFCLDMRFASEEKLRIIGVDSALHYTAHRDFPGFSSGVSVQMRDVMRFLIRIGADGFFAVHNHRSNPKPSREDEIFTSKLLEAGDILGVRLIDHVIISPKGYYSFSEEGNGWISRTRG